ncbi:GrpB family protein [Kordiimonas lipolytica]|uniref:GrpB family protein n=1 Tax=Kordiimonas lipolytica TaxID=1662421 RepID=A0ABV8UCP6_9PROT|nr:GrpB family protein [Kordiimonas lipolytica]
MTEKFYIQHWDAALLKRQAEATASAVKAILPDADVREVGSTAVAGAIGKQDIDLLVRVAPNAFTEARDTLDEVFPRNSEQLSTCDFQGYLIPDDLDVAVQLTVHGGQYDVFLPFLDALTSDAVLLEAYNQLKRDWHGKSMQDYRTAKSTFIEAVLADLG